MYNALDSTHKSQWLAAEADFIEVQLFQILPPGRKEYLNASCCDQFKIVIRTVIKRSHKKAMNQFIYWNFNTLAEFLHQITKKLINWTRLKPKIEFHTLRITGKYDWSLVFFPKSYNIFPSKRQIFGQMSKQVEELPITQKIILRVPSKGWLSIYSHWKYPKIGH